MRAAILMALGLLALVIMAGCTETSVRDQEAYCFSNVDTGPLGYIHTEGVDDGFHCNVHITDDEYKMWRFRQSVIKGHQCP